MRWHRPPFELKEIKVELTHRCLLKCVHCSSKADDKCMREMDWPTCVRLLREAAEMGVRQVAFSGGEPLLWDRLDEAVRLARNHRMEVHVYTSGNAPDACASLSRLVGAGLRFVMLSLFGSKPERHDQVTTVRGSFAETLHATRHCVAEGLETEFHFVPMNNNFEELRDICELAKELGVLKVSVLRLVPQGRGAEGEDKQLNPRENRVLRRTIKCLRSEGHVIRLGSPYNFLMIRDNPRCCAAIDRITISPDLRVSPCDAFKGISPAQLGVDDRLYYLSGHSLHECWEESPYLNAIRRYLTTEFPQECATCAALERCASGCLAQKVHAFGSLVKRPDPMCLRARASC